VPVLGAGEVLVPHVGEGAIHRIERVDRGGEDGELGDLVEPLGQRPAVEHVHRVRDRELPDRHGVHRQRAGFVDADGRRRPERLDDGRPPCQDMPL
jgi:hypothetical protein